MVLVNPLWIECKMKLNPTKENLKPSVLLYFLFGRWTDRLSRLRQETKMIHLLANFSQS